MLKYIVHTHIMQCFCLINARSLFSKICDNGDDETDGGEYSANVGHPSEGKSFRRRAICRGWQIWFDILWKGKCSLKEGDRIHDYLMVACMTNGTGDSAFLRLCMATIMHSTHSRL